MAEFLKMKWCGFLVGLCSVCLVHALHAQEFLNLNTNIILQPAANINTKFLEYAPIYYDAGIVFVHAKEQSQLVDRRLGMPFFELMYAELGPDGLPGKSKSFSANIRTRFHEGPATFTRDLKQVIFTRSNTSNGEDVVGADKRINLKLYVADKGAEDWENQRELPFCSDDYSAQSPTLSPDNQQLIFMSDMPGGYGGWDLYISDKYNGTWSEPINLGPTINSPKNERSPFWHDKGVLFFSSDGHGGSGGLDIFASVRQEDGTFSAPVNLGKNFNSRQDDLSFICDPDGKSGFFASSRREGLGKDDIYHWTSDESIFSVSLLEREQVVDLLLTIGDASTLDPVAGASAWLYKVGPLGPEGLEESFEKRPTVTPEGEQIIALEYKRDGAPAALISDIKGAIPVKLDPLSDYLVILRADAYQQREVSLSHNVIRNSKEYFIDMARKKAEAPDMIPNKDCLPVGALVLGEAHKTPIPGALVQVRSTCTGTVKVLETDTEGRFKTCVIPGCDYEVTLLKTGYLEQKYRFVPGTDPEKKTVYMSEEDLEARTGGTPAPGDVLVLDHIYYDFNKSAIRTGDARELESLAKMMQKYHAMTIEIESHTDSRGSADYNLELSERRAASVLEFLETRGISSSRIQLKPMGESMLRNGCTDGVPCTEEEHQMNRRTEIRILTVDPRVEVRYPDQE